MTEEVEKLIKDQGCDKRPRITPEYIKSLIRSTAYLSGAHALELMPSHQRTDDTITVQALNSLTICIIILKNGFTIVGKSACVFPENFNMIVGRRIAHDDAMRQIYQYEGYLLAEQRWSGLHDPSWHMRPSTSASTAPVNLLVTGTEGSPAAEPITFGDSDEARNT